MNGTDDSFNLILQDLIDHPFDGEEFTSDSDSEGSEPVLHEMAREEKAGILREALELGEGLTEKLTEENEKGQTPLMAAAAGGSAEAIRLLLESGADPTERDDGGQRALSLAVQSGSQEAAECLIGAGVEVADSTSESDPTGNGPNGNGSIERDAAGRDAAGSDATGSGPIEENPSSLVFAAVKSGSAETLGLILDEGAKADVTGYLDRTPLHYAAEESEAKTRLLLEAGATVDHVDDYGRTPLNFAAGGGQPGAIRALLSEGADPTRTDPSGETPLHHAVSRDKEAPLKILIEHEADVDKPNAWGETPLHKAASLAHFGPARVLLEAGADPLAENDDGETPTQVDHSALLPDEVDEINTLIRGYMRD